MANNSFIIKASQIKTMKKLLLTLRNVAKNKRKSYLYLDHFVYKREGPKGQKTNVFQTRDHKNLSCLQLQYLQI